MAVAILMMNMHGAVCVSDRDMTILCYKDGTPFAIMVDPNSKPWEDIFDKFRLRHPDLTDNYVGTFKQYLKEESNMGLITREMFGGAEDFISQTYLSLVDDFKLYLLSIAENGIARDSIKTFLNNAKLDEKLHPLAERFQKDLNDCLNKAITFYHIEDMVKILEDLVNAENLQNHLLHPKEPIGSTKEIATLTLAEGFKWIKHSLYGA